MIGLRMIVAAGALALGCSASGHATSSAVQAVQKPVVDSVVSSPDGRRVAVLERAGRAGMLAVGRTHGPRRVIYRTRTCCRDVSWASSRVLAFDDDFWVETVDVETRRLRTLADAYDFALSKDGRWIAWARPGGEGPDSVGVVSIDGRTCLRVRRPVDVSDSLPFFHPDGRRLYFLREWLRADGTSQGKTVSVALARLRRGPGCFG